MSGTINKVILIGHLGDEVKMTYFEGGNSIGRFPIATNESYTNKQTGQKVINTEWHAIVVRNKLAEICEKYLTKGDKVYCEGRIKTRQWLQEGQKRYTTEIHVANMTFLSTKKETGASALPSNDKSSISTSQEKNTTIEDDFPF